MDTESFIRYLAAKKSVDDRALNRRVWHAMISAVRSTAAQQGGPRVLELGGGIGTMVERVIEEDRLRPGSWTMIDAQPALVAEAHRRLAGRAPFPVELLAAELHSFLASAFRPFDLVVANAFLDLLDPQLALPPISELGRPGGLFLFSITFDGLTVFEPEIDRELDDRVLEALSPVDGRTYRGRVEIRDSRCGRHLLTLLPRCGYRIVEAGSSDWIVYPQGGRYLADERFFLSCILDFFEESLTARATLEPAELRRWLRARREQMDAGVLVFLAHQLDVLASTAASL